MQNSSENHFEDLDKVINKRAKGNKAEDFAFEYLIKSGFNVIKRNFTFSRYGEIDIIAKKQNVIIFFEIRSKHNNSPYEPILSIGYAKQKNMRKAAEGYLYINKINDQECRFDLITVDYSHNSEKPQIEHLENIL